MKNILIAVIGIVLLAAPAAAQIPDTNFESPDPEASTTGNIRNEVSTLETRRPETSFPQSIWRGVMSVVSSRSSVCRSRSLVTLPALKLIEERLS